MDRLRLSALATWTSWSTGAIVWAAIGPGSSERSDVGAVTGINCLSGRARAGAASNVATLGGTRRRPEAWRREAESIDGRISDSKASGCPQRLVRVRIARAELRCPIRRGESCLAPGRGSKVPTSRKGEDGGNRSVPTTKSLAKRTVIGEKDEIYKDVR